MLENRFEPSTVSEFSMCLASGASHGSSKCSSTTSISGHTARSGNQGSAFGIHVRSLRQCARDQAARERELDVGAHTVVRARARPEVARQPL